MAHTLRKSMLDLSLRPQFKSDFAWKTGSAFKGMNGLGRISRLLDVVGVKTWDLERNPVVTQQKPHLPQ